MSVFSIFIKSRYNMQQLSHGYPGRDRSYHTLAVHNSMDALCAPKHTRQPQTYPDSPATHYCIQSERSCSCYSPVTVTGIELCCRTWNNIQQVGYSFTATGSTQPCQHLFKLNLFFLIYYMLLIAWILIKYQTPIDGIEEKMGYKKGCSLI